MKRYFADYPLDERKALWEKYLPRVQNEFDDYNYSVARDSFAETFPDYMNMTEFEGVPFDPKDKSHVALANMFGWDDSYWDDWENDYSDTESLEKTGAYKMESFETMFRKAKGYDMREEADERFVPDRDVLERLATLPPEMQRKVLDQIDNLNPSTPWDIKPKFSMEGDDGWESGEQEVVIPEKHMPGKDGWVSGSGKSVEKSIRERIARDCFEKTGRIPDVEFMDTYEVKKAADEADFNEMADAVSNRNRMEEIAENKENADIMGVPQLDPYRNKNYYASLKRGDLPTDADRRAHKQYLDKQEGKPYRKEISEAVNLTAPMMRQGPARGHYAGETANELVAYNTGILGGNLMARKIHANEELEEGVSSALVNILTKKYGLDAESAQGAAMEFIRGVYNGRSGPYPPEWDTGYGGESDEEYAERMQNTRKRLKSEKKI